MFRSSFNKSLCIEIRPERLTGEPGDVLLREIMERTRIIELLVERLDDSSKGADADAKDANGGPALLWAVAGGKAEIVELLIAHGADLGARDGDGTGALELARKRGKHAVIELLERAGAVE